MILLDRPQYQLELIRQGQILVQVKAGAKRLATRLNKILRYYPQDTRFSEHDEPRFIFDLEQKSTVFLVFDALGIRDQEGMLKNVKNAQNQLSNPNRFEMAK